ncbi:hypothetical protein GCM10027043_05240 [Ferruginibacter profundus]
MIKDHLGNVRMVLTDEQQVDHYPTATLEGTGAGSLLEMEKTYYDIPNPSTYVVAKPANAPNYINDNGTNNPNTFGSPTANSQKMYQLNGASNKTGPSMVLKVMAGDKLDLLAKSWYEYASGTVTNNAFNAGDLITAFLGTGAAANPAVLHGGTYSILNSNTSGTVTPLSNFITNSSNTNPYNNVKAGVCYILFDEQFNLVSCQFDPVYVDAATGGHGSSGGPGGGLKNHVMQYINVPKNGYLYVYCSNESNINVFFDNLEVIHTRGQILEETHYYPFGLTMQGISSKAADKLNNKIKFASKELQSKEFSDGTGLDWTDFGARMYDNQIGRWMNPDPLSDKYFQFSPYQYSANNPILFVDKDGKDFGIIVDPKTKTITITGNYYANNNNTNSLDRTKAAVESLNKLSGDYSFKTKGGDEYKINFDLKAIDNEGHDGMVNDDPIGNRLFEVSDLGMLLKHANGETSGGNTIMVVDESTFKRRTNEDGIKLDEHEILHTLGVSHNAMGKLAEKLKITDKTIIGILKHANMQDGGNKLSVKGNKKYALASDKKANKYDQPSSKISDANGEPVNLEGEVIKNN